AGNDLALHQQALDACIDQAGTELREVEHADDQREQTGHIEKDDAAAETRKGNADEEVPALEQQGCEPPPAFRARCAVIAPFQLDIELLQRSIELAQVRSGGAGEAIPALK